MLEQTPNIDFKNIFTESDYTFNTKSEDWECRKMFYDCHV